MLVSRTLGKAWQVMKAELFHRSKSHSKFATEVCIIISYDLLRKSIYKLYNTEKL